MSRDLAERAHRMIAFLSSVVASGERLNDDDRAEIRDVLRLLAESTPAALDEEGLDAIRERAARAETDHTTWFTEPVATLRNDRATLLRALDAQQAKP